MLYIFPNPNTEGILNLKISGSTNQEAVNIEVYDYSGRLIMSQNIEEDANPTIDISHLTKGVYLLQYVSNQQIISKRLIIQ